MKKEMKNKEKIQSFIIVICLLSLLSNPLFQHNVITLVKGQAGGVGASAVDYNSTLSVQVIHSAPRINWYGFQKNDSGTWIDRLNQKIEVDNRTEYRFIVNISSDQGWDDIEFINLTAWYDNGSETSTYNQTKGGNLNLNYTYENTSGTALFYHWDHEEVRNQTCVARVVNDTLYGLEGETEARNITFSFIPNKQFRYAPGENTSWNTTSHLHGNSSKYGLYNNYSWNFNITIDDSEGYRSWVTDEFGVYRYSEILSAQNPAIVGYPDGNFSVNDIGGSGNITVITCSNGNYNLSAEVEDLVHENLPSHSINKTNVYVQGGNRTTFKSLSNPVYLYGGGQEGMPEYHQAEPDGNSKNTSKIEYKCYVPYGQLAGKYSAQITYHLTTEEQ